jgi:hypothetical protein
MAELGSPFDRKSGLDEISKYKLIWIVLALAVASLRLDFE